MCSKNILGHHFASDALASNVPYLQRHLDITFNMAKAIRKPSIAYMYELYKAACAAIQRECR